MILEYTEEAEADFAQIWQYSFENWGVVRATGYLDRLADAADALVYGDLSGTTADEVRPGLRRLVAGSHVIWFRVEDDRLRVIRVMHKSRDVGRWVG